jgi:type II secretory pathway pseudopilin PulG
MLLKSIAFVTKPIYQWRNCRSQTASVKRTLGFTLAELLVCLLILGEIATFTIPKIIMSQSNAAYNAGAKEAISTMSAAYQRVSLSNGISTATQSNDLTPYLNYVAIDTATVVDNTSATITCTSSGLNRCFRLHNGAMLVWHNGESFSGSNTTNGLWFLIDPDGAVSLNKGVIFYVLYNGRVTTAAQSSSITSSVATYSTAADPSWFSW